MTLIIENNLANQEIPQSCTDKKRLRDGHDLNSKIDKRH